MDHESLQYPHRICCFAVREDKRPEDDPVVVVVVYTPSESEYVEDHLKYEYPDCWVTHLPID